jgi:hypothetical protein
VEIGSVCSKLDYSAEFTKQQYLLKQNHVCEKQENRAHFFLVQTEFILKGIVLANHSFQDGESLMLLQVDSFI